MQKFKLQRETIYFLIIIFISILVRLYYINFISIYDMQHDVGTVDRYYGHLGYITYFLRNWQLPDFDVREAFQFWHPPVHHFLSAVFLKALWSIFPFLNGNYEPLQLLPLLYITISLYIIWKLLKIWNLKGYSLFLPFLIIAFHPTFILLSGSVNNDSLCFLFTLLSIYFSICWYQNPTYTLIILSALSIGLGMSTKGTAFIAAFPMAFIFTVGFIKRKKQALWQLCLFAIIALPLGLWWYIRNYFLWGVPFNYIYRTSTDAIGYLANVPIWNRVLDFDIRRFSFWNVYVQFEGRFMEINPIIALLKSAVYGQCWFNYNIYIRLIAYPLVFIWILFTILSLTAILKLIKKNSNMIIENIGILILFISQFISYYSFCLEYPFVWTMDIRYAISLLVCHILWLGYFIKFHPRSVIWLRYFTIAFVFLTNIVFFLFSFTTFK